MRALPMLDADLRLLMVSLMCRMIVVGDAQGKSRFTVLNKLSLESAQPSVVR